MKLTIIGGAGTRVPLVVVGLVRFHDQLRTDELALWDPNRERQALIARLCDAMAQRYGVPLKIRAAGNAEDAVSGADFIISSIRVGGGSVRIMDERIALEHNVLGQETVGPGGWAMALRSFPPMLEYVRLAERVAPHAWILNFTNPVGIVSQALLAAGAKRVIGVCDTPREMFEAAARELAISSPAAFFDYFGLNHLGWLRRVLVNGEDQLPRLLRDPQRAASVYHVPLFERDFIQQLGMLPTEYVYFYVKANEATAKLKKAGSTRGQMVAEQERVLFQSLASDGATPEKMLAAYDNYLATRNATYFALETGAAVSEQALEHARGELYQKAAGYERIAVDVMRAIARNSPAVFPVDVANNGSIDGLGAQDAVEVPCVIDANGARPLAVGEVPASVRELFFRVKDYERLTAEAALCGSASVATRALAANPLVNDMKKADELARAYREAHRPWLDYLN